MKISANAEIIKSIKMNQLMWAVSNIQIPGSQFLLPCFLSFIMELSLKRKFLVLHPDNFPVIGLHIDIDIYI